MEGLVWHRRLEMDIVSHDVKKFFRVLFKKNSCGIR